MQNAHHEFNLEFVILETYQTPYVVNVRNKKHNKNRGVPECRG